MKEIYRNASTLYVSQTGGDDGASGLSPETALKTLDRALEIVCALREQESLRPMTVALTEDYLLSAPLRIAEPGGVTITSYGKMRRLIGGVAVSGWVRDVFRGVPCLSAPIPKDAGGNAVSMTDLFVCGKRAAVTRYPKSGELKVLQTEQELRGGDPFTLTSGSSGWFRLDPKELCGIDGIEHATINYFHYWIDEHSPIRSYDPESGMCEMQYRSRFSASSMYDEGHPSSVRYYLTNLPSTFGEPNEWYADLASGRVYYIPAEGVSPENIEAYTAVLDHLLSVECDDVTLEHLSLCISRSGYASTMEWDPESGAYRQGTIPHGADIQSVCWAPGAIRVSHASRFRMRHCRLFGLGVHGVCLAEGTQNARIEDSEIYDIAAGGIKLVGGAVGCDDADLTSHITLRRNHIHHCGRVHEAGCGILAMHVSHLEIAENEIHDLTYSGISVGWVWGYAESNTYGNLIRDNHIYRIGGESLSDMGGIYLLGRQRGTVVSGNRIHDISCLHYGAWGIYLDEGSSFVTVEGNAVYRAKSSSFHMHYGSNNTVSGNVFFGGASPCIQLTRPEAHDRLLFSSNILVSDGAPIYTGGGCACDGIGSSNNLIVWRSAGEPVMLVPSEGAPETLSDWQRVRGREVGTVVTSDGGFADLDGFDFSLSQVSPALALGFLPLPDSAAKPR